MRVLHNDERTVSPSAQRAYDNSTVEDREKREETEEREDIDQVGIPLKQYPTSGSRTKVEEPEEDEHNGDISIELRDHEEDDDFEPDENREEDRERRRRSDIEVTDEDMASWVGQPAIKGSTESMRMALLTLSLIGLQYALLPFELHQYLTYQLDLHGE